MAYRTDAPLDFSQPKQLFKNVINCLFTMFYKMSSIVFLSRLDILFGINLGNRQRLPTQPLPEQLIAQHVAG